MCRDWSSFFVFYELYLRKDKRKDPEIFSTDESQLGLPFVGISFILFKQQSAILKTVTVTVSQKSGIRSEDHYSGNSSLLTRPK